MQIIAQVMTYLFPVLLALAILYFFAGKAISQEPDYAKIPKGEKMVFTALASIFVILVTWAVVHSLVAVIV